MGTSLGTDSYPIFILYKTNVSSYTFVEVSNMTIELEEHLLWFKYDPSEKFVKDLYKVWDTEVVFLAIETSLLVNLYYSNKNYFKIPAAKTRMNLDAYFFI